MYYILLKDLALSWLYFLSFPIASWAIFTWPKKLCVQRTIFRFYLIRCVLLSLYVLWTDADNILRIIRERYVFITYAVEILVIHGDVCEWIGLRDETWTTCVFIRVYFWHVIFLLALEICFHSSIIIALQFNTNDICGVHVLKIAWPWTNR